MARVEVVYCPEPGRVDTVTLDLPAGATLADAVRRSGVLDRHAVDPSLASFGVWGRKRPPETVLRERDRVELYRALTVDPKEARRLRYKRQRSG